LKLTEPGASALSYGEHPMAIGGFGDHDAAMHSSLRRIVLLLVTAAVFALATTGCQTTKGFGKDVQKLGDKIEDKAS
jgi:predicted small secreted protein